MKYRLLFVLTGLLMLLTAGGFQLVEDSIGTARYLQHEEELPPAETKPDDPLATHLPILRVDTGGAPIPWVDLDGEPQDGLPVGTRLDPQCTVEVIDTAGVWHCPTDAPGQTLDATIRIRGNSSREFDKKSYLLNLTDPEGLTDEAHPLLGMTAAAEWVLNGPCLDRTLVRNYVAYTVAGQIMTWAPNVRFCELILNGEYRGVYLLVEAITKGEGRVDLTEPEPGRPMTSWLIRWDRDGKADTPLDTFTYYTYQAGVSAPDLRYPGKNTVTPERIAYVTAELSDIERAIYSTDFKDPAKGYARYLNVDAFADYFIINELFGNVDAGRFSTYYYKDIRGKVTPVVWDFNNGADNYINYTYDSSGFSLTDSPWFGQLMRDEAFVDTVVRHYQHYRESLLSDDALKALIDGAVTFLGDAVDRNYTVWGYLFDLTETDDVNYLDPVERNYTVYEQAVEQLRDWLTARARWLDRNMDTLYQYSHESKNAARIID